MATVAKAIVGDTATSLKFTCKDADTKTVINLTGVTPKILWKIAGGTKVTKTLGDGVTVADPPTSGIITYQFKASDLTAGRMVGEVELTGATSEINTSLKFYIQVEARI